MFVSFSPPSLFQLHHPSFSVMGLSILFSLFFFFLFWVTSLSSFLFHFPSALPTITLSPHCHSPFCPSLLPPPSAIIRYPPACPGGIPGARIGITQRRRLGQAAATGAAVWVVQSSEFAAACQRPGIHRLRHQVHGAGQPRGFLEWLPERSSAGGPEGSIHHGLSEERSGLRRHAPADQCGPRRLRGGPKAAES